MELSFVCFVFFPGPVTSANLIEANIREEETRLEVERLTAEIRTLKLQILQLTGKDVLLLFYSSLLISCDYSMNSKRLYIGFGNNLTKWLG